MYTVSKKGIPYSCLRLQKMLIDFRIIALDTVRILYWMNYATLFNTFRK